MLSVGTDLIEIKRLKKSIQNDYFLKRVFGENEIAELKSKNMKAESVAAAFAAKEAFSKAIGTGIRGFSLPEVELLHDSFGAPYFKFSGRAKEIVEKSDLKFSVSLTHTEELAGAIVAAYTE